MKPAPLPAYQQQLLNFDQEKDFQLEHFIFSNNPLLPDLLRYPLSQNLYLYGDRAYGKTHLLHALYQQYLQQQKQAIFIPLAKQNHISAEILHNLHTFALVCVDDLHRIAGQGDWEKAFYHLYNLCAQSGCKLVFTANGHPDDLGITLADLHSRLKGCVNYSIQPLDDEGKINFLMARAQRRSLHLSYPVARFLISRIPRSMIDLVNVLEQLELLTLRYQNMLTIPFIKKHLHL